jgi:DNA-binding protein WhiA
MAPGRVRSSYSESVRNELARVTPARPCCELAELAGLARAAGVIRISAGGLVSLVVRTSQPQVARRTFLLMKGIASGPVRMSVLRDRRLGRGNTFSVEAPLGAGGVALPPVLARLGLVDRRGSLTDGLPRGRLTRACCRKACLRGLFLGAGSVTDPEHGYHLEILATSSALADAVRDLMARTVPGMTVGGGAGVHERQHFFAVYVKDAGLINNLLRTLGAGTGSFVIERALAMKDLRNEVNRRVNAETANLGKTIRAAVEQAEDIKRIDRVYGLHRLPDGLRGVARARLAAPEASLVEIGARLRPRLSKSAVNHRMRRLRQLAAALKKGEAGPGDSGGY